MRKLVMSIGLGLIAGSVWAANMGPYTWDDTGAFIQAPTSIPVLSSTTISNLNNRQYSMVICNGCANSLSTYSLCIATQTATGNLGPNFVIIGSTTGASPACK